MKKISDFQPQRQNANKHTPRGQGMLQNTIRNHGWIGAITTTADDESELDMGVGDRQPKEMNCVCPACGHEFVKQM